MADRNPPDGPVRLAPYDPTWRDRFEDEATTLQATIGAFITGGIHHVGAHLHLIPTGSVRLEDDIASFSIDRRVSRACA